MAVSSASAHCYQTHWIAENLALHYAPFAPHYVGLTPPQTPAVAAPWPRPYRGLGLVRSWQRSARWSALSRRQWPTPWWRNPQWLWAIAEYIVRSAVPFGPET